MNEIQQKLLNGYNEYVARFNEEPNYASVIVRFKGEDEDEFQIIRILNDSEQDADTESFFDDDEIFFYVQNFDELLGLCDPDNGEDFVVVGYTSLYFDTIV